MSGRRLFDLLGDFVVYASSELLQLEQLQSAFSTVPRASVLAQADVECKL